MSDVAQILDSSALLATILGEPGGLGGDALQRSGMSAVNLSEVIAKLIERGADSGEAVADIAELGVTIVPFSEAHAVAAARLRPLTKRLGLSLGDRACLALGLALDLPVFTADRTWLRVKGGPTVKAIR